MDSLCSGGNWGGTVSEAPLVTRIGNLLSGGSSSSGRIGDTESPLPDYTVGGYELLLYKEVQL